jgi:ribonuclease HI
MDGRSRKPLPDTPVADGPVTAFDDESKARLCCAHYARVSRIRVERRRSKRAYLAIRRRIKAGGGTEEELSAFTLGELRDALARGRGRAPGPDGIHPDMLRRLPANGQVALCALINRSWHTGEVPALWRSGIIVPILKNAKPTAEIKSYRPVTLLCCTSKVMERMVMARLDFWQRRAGLVPPEQAGFQAGRSTVDCIAQIAQPAFDALQARKLPSRSLLVAVDLRAAFDRVWRGGLLEMLANAEVPGRWLRWLRSWMSDRRAAARWNNEVSKKRVFKAGVPQGSPLSPLLFVIFAAGAIAAVRDAAPEVQVTVYADDITLVARHPLPTSAATMMQPALDALASWAATNEVKIAADKTEALVITSHPNEVNAKCHPRLTLNGSDLTYNPEPKILGVHFDSQLRFGPQARFAVAKLSSRINVLRALAGTDWGCDEDTLRSLYTGYARPGALYAGGVWHGFLAPTHARRLESANYRAARVIVQAPAGSNSIATRREAGLCSIGALVRRDAGRLLLHARRFPSDHAVGRLALPPVHPRRLRTTGGQLRGCWFDLATDSLASLPRGAIPEPWPLPHEAPPPWAPDGQDLARFVLAGADVPRNALPEERRFAALQALAELREEDEEKTIEIWTDGAAIDGLRNGGAGCVVKWPGVVEPTVQSRPAGLLVSSTDAESVAAEMGLRLAAESEQTAANYRILFDSRALFDRLQRHPMRLVDSPSSLRAAGLLDRLAALGRVTVVWVPGHAGLPLNELADRAARAGCDMAQEDTRLYVEELGATAGAAHIHFEASKGGERLDVTGLSREEAVRIHRLRLNRLPDLQKTKHRWRHDGATTATCRRCGEGIDDTPHFLTVCPALAPLRRTILGAQVSLDVLQTAPRAVASFLRNALPPPGQ